MMGKWRSVCAVGSRDPRDVDRRTIATESQRAGLAMPSSAIPPGAVNRPVSTNPDQERAWLDFKGYEYHRVPRSSLGNPGLLDPYDQLAGSAVKTSLDESGVPNSSSAQSQGEGSSNTSATPSGFDHNEDFMTRDIIPPGPSSSAHPKSSWDAFANNQQKVSASSILPFTTTAMSEEEFAKLASQFYPPTSGRAAEHAFQLPHGWVESTGMTPDVDGWSQILEGMSSWEDGVPVSTRLMGTGK